MIVFFYGGKWQSGTKEMYGFLAAALTARGYVVVIPDYRLYPEVRFPDFIADSARALRWTRDNIAAFGGDARLLFVMGHSAGAQLAALVCTDERYLKAEGLPLTLVKGCVPVDGDTYDVPAIIEVAETRWRVHGPPPAKLGHREKFGNDPAMHRDLSAVTHVAKGKGIPPFLLLYVAGHPDTTAQALRLGNVLKAAGLPATLFGAKETTHARINADLGKPDDPATKALLEFLGKALKK